MKFLVLFALVLYCSSEVLGKNDKPQCEGIQCGIPICHFRDILKIPLDDDTACCPYCERKPRCTGLQCSIPRCFAGTVITLVSGDCCPSCQPAR
uniref:Uncharacterized protein DDB_G0274171-like isoform X1 n=1 Tax=Diabrotica virgifera virgifera TaxID=50390 RepID=A0A6P7FRX5_DIAVI